MNTVYDRLKKFILTMQEVSDTDQLGSDEAIVYNTPVRVYTHTNGVYYTEDELTALQKASPIKQYSKDEILALENEMRKNGRL